jgi:hypothetical protein
MRDLKGRFIKGNKFPKSEEFRKKVSKTLMGHLISEETKNKISKTLIGRKLTEGHIEKLKAKSWMNNQSGENNRMWKGGISKTVEYKRHMRKENKLKRKQVEGSHTLEEWNQLCKTYQYMCLCCKSTDVKLTEDHIIPISMGGTNDIWNIQPLCGSCNSIKHAKTIDYRERMVI